MAEGRANIVGSYGWNFLNISIPLFSSSCSRTVLGVKADLFLEEALSMLIVPSLSRRRLVILYQNGKTEPILLDHMGGIFLNISIPLSARRAAVRY